MYVRDHPGDDDVAMCIDIASIGLRYPVVNAYMREVHFALLCPVVSVVLIGADWDNSAGVWRTNLKLGMY
jgi:hypothetical protein